MSKNALTPTKKVQNALGKRPASSDYEVGYGKPPTATRFKPGRSGNPKGRPRGSKNKAKGPLEERLKEIILKEAYRTFKVNDGPKQVTVPMAQAVIRSLAHNAVKGNPRSQRLFSEMLASTEAANFKRNEELLENAIEYKQNWNKELKLREKFGIIEPDPVPHPDHIIINPHDGSVRITGPMTIEDKQVWDMLSEKRAECQAEVEDLKKDLEDPDQAGYRSFIEDEIRHSEKLIAMIDDKIGDYNHER